MFRNRLADQRRRRRLTVDRVARFENLESRCLLAADTIKILAGGGVDETHDDGDAATSLDLFTPIAVALDSADNVYYSHASVIDAEELIVKVDANSGTITKVAGGGSDTTPSNGDLATNLSLSNPRGVALDSNDHVYFSDTELNLIIKVDASSGQITILAGGGTDTTINTGDTATGLRLSSPEDLAVDSAGDVYFAHDDFSSSDRQIVKLDVSTGLVQTIAGGGADTAPATGDAGTDLQLSGPGGVALDADGNVYFTDTGRDRVIRVDATSGLIDVLAGGGNDLTINNGDTATNLDLTTPVDVAVDAGGVVSFTHREGVIGNTGVFRIDPITRQIITLAGGGTDSTPDDGDSATDLALFTPNGLTFDQAGNLIFVDTGESLVIKVGDAISGGSGTIEIDLVAGDVEIVADGDEVVVRQGTGEVFRGLGTSVTGFSITGSNGDDTVEWGNLSGAIATPVPFVFDGGNGLDTLQLRGSGQLLDLTDRTTNALTNVEAIDVVGVGANTLILDEQSILDATDDNDKLLIAHDEQDNVTYAGDGWDVQRPIFVAGGLRHRLSTGNALLEIINTLPYQNPLIPTDANFSEESSSLDALLIINFLRLFPAVPVELSAPTTADELPEWYVDVNASGTASALDALLVINLLRERSNEILKNEAASSATVLISYRHQEEAHEPNDSVRENLLDLDALKLPATIAKQKSFLDLEDRAEIIDSIMLEFDTETKKNSIPDADH